MAQTYQTKLEAESQSVNHTYSDISTQRQHPTTEGFRILMM